MWLVIALIITYIWCSFTTKASLDISSTASLPYVISKKITVLCMCTFVFNMVFILLQIILLKYNFKQYQLMKISVAIIFSIFLNISVDKFS